jgi:type VI secretion system protein ImpA
MNTRDESRALLCCARHARLFGDFPGDLPLYIRTETTNHRFRKIDERLKTAGKSIESTAILRPIPGTVSAGNERSHNYNSIGIPMASAELITTESLVRAFEGGNPAGNDIRRDSSPSSPYHAVKTARQSARAAERNSVFDHGNNEADVHWRKVLELAPEILANQAKDLEIASWYVEALVRCHGFRGLRDGLRLVRQLIEQFWDALYPLPDEDGIATRVAPLAGLNGEGAEGVLIAPIRNVPITEGKAPGPFSLWHYQQARDVQKISDEKARAQKIEKLGFTVDNIEKAVNESSETFFVDCRDDLKSCVEAYREINRVLTERCGVRAAPPTSNIIGVLQECLDTINHVARHKLPVEPEPAAAEGEEASGDGSGTAMSAGPIKSREQAFRQLRTIAQFFRQTEPHSPISYVLDKAVKWGGMPLSELIFELIPDSSSREHYSTLTGVRGEKDA